MLLTLSCKFLENDHKEQNDCLEAKRNKDPSKSEREIRWFFCYKNSLSYHKLEHVFFQHIKVVLHPIASTCSYKFNTE